MGFLFLTLLRGHKFRSRPRHAHLHLHVFFLFFSVSASWFGFGGFILLFVWSWVCLLCIARAKILKHKWARGPLCHYHDHCFLGVVNGEWPTRISMVCWGLHTPLRWGGKHGPIWQNAFPLLLKGFFAPRTKNIVIRTHENWHFSTFLDVTKYQQN